MAPDADPAPPTDQPTTGPVSSGAPPAAEAAAGSPPSPASSAGEEADGTSGGTQLVDDLEGEMEEAAAVVEADIDVLDVLSTTERERDEYLEALRRLQADFENYKKRIVRQQTEALERAGEDLVVKLLPVLDTIDLARQHGAGEGLDAVATALFDVLAKEGLERIDPVGQPFDPNEHEAVSHDATGEADEPEVVSVMRAGYRWRGRLVRAAMVTVRG